MKNTNYFFASFLGFIPGFFIWNTIGAGVNTFIKEADEFSIFNLILSDEITCDVIDNTVSGGRVLRFDHDEQSLYNFIDNHGLCPLPPYIKKELIKPTKIYVRELNKINEKKLINGCANITGGGLLNNIIRIIPDKLCLNIDLSKIKIKPIFKWLKKNNIKDSEMLKTFNCGVGFCLITNKKNIKYIKKIFTKEYLPYQIGFISREKLKVKTFGKLQW